MSTNTEDYEWLGIVYPDDVKPKVAFITPLAFYDDDMWNPIQQKDTFYYFPNNGKAAVFAKDFSTSKIGRLCYFRPERNPLLSSPEVTRYSHYIVNGELEFEPLSQILNWTPRAKESLELPDLLEEGVKIIDCFSQRIYIRYQDYLFGPIQLECTADQLRPFEYVHSSSTGGHPLLVSVYEVPEDSAILKLGDVPHHHYFLNENVLPSPVDQEDWSQPQVVIKRVLKASNDVLSNIENDSRLVDRRLRELTRLSSSDGPPALQIEQATLARAQYIMDHQMERLNDLRILVEELPAEHPLLQAVREQEIQLRLTEIERQAEARIQSQMDRLKELQRDLQEAEARVQTEHAHLQELQNNIQEAEEQKAQAQGALEIFEREMQQRVERLREEPLRVLAEIQMAASLFPMLERNGRSANEMLAQQVYGPYSTHNHQSVQHRFSVEDALTWISDDSTEAIGADLSAIAPNFWVRFAQQAKVKSNDIRVCVAALLTGFIPMVNGQAAMSLMRSVTQAIASGRAWSVPVPLTALTPLDLFGMIDTERHMFIPTAGGFADIILQARKHPRELALVILEGLDRVPGMPVYVPLLRQYLESRQIGSVAKRSTPLNLFHPRTLVPDDLYLELARFTWPSNLLLAVTCDSDLSSVPLPSTCDPWFIRLEAEHSSGNVSPSTSASSSHVPLDVWQRWEQEICRKAVSSSNNQEILDYRERIFRSALTMVKVSNPDDVIEQALPKQTRHDADKAVRKEAY